MAIVIAVKVYRTLIGTPLRVLPDGRVEYYSRDKVWQPSVMSPEGMARDKHAFELVAKNVVFK